MDAPQPQGSEQPPLQRDGSPGQKLLSVRLYRRWAIGVGAALIVLALGALLLARAPEVEVARSRAGPAIESVYASGVVDFVRQARVAPVINAPIRAVRVREGDQVRAGQILVELVAGPEEATALQLDAQAAQARAAYARTDRLYQKGFAAAAAREDALRLYQAAAAAARAAHERLRDFKIAAPFSGWVLRRDAERGDMAKVGAPLFVIADPASLRITADIDERDAGRVRSGLEALARSDAFPGRQFPARVTELTPQGDATARVFRARLRLDPDSLLRPGMTVEVNIILNRRDNAVLAPTNAVRDGVVWVVEDGRAYRRPVQIGIQDADRTEIRSGLVEEEVVIIDPPSRLKDGARVRLRAAGGSS